ncbi:ABC transporter permease [Draconibacterium sediminis]|uniref:ABC transporter permease n=1 Tax=Draconibacterium sediminis TaxID=1544798 RepID=UPI0026EF8CA2|nr:ABC transporter permease [Draconibacterium sediminis]
MINQLKIAFRFFRNNGTFTFLNIIGLAFGFTCAIMILMHVGKEKSYNKSIPEHERVFYLAQKSPGSPLGNTTISYALPVLLSEHFPEIEYFARTENYSQFSNCIVSYRPDGKNEIYSFNERSFCLADVDFFQIIQYPFIEGSPESAFDNVSSIVLSKETAAKYFGGEPALGKTLMLNNDKFYTVTGVVDIPEYVTFSFSMIAPIKSLRSDSNLAGWDSNGQPLFKLQKNTDYKAFNQKIKNFYTQLNLENIPDPKRLTLELIPSAERRLFYNKRPLYLLIFIGIVVLAVSVLNYVNLSTSLIQKRTSEIAIRKISGAVRWMIGKQFVRETAIVSFFAVLTGALLAKLGVTGFETLTGSDIRYFLSNNLDLFIGGSLLLWIIVTLSASFYPALILSGVRPISVFKKERRTGTGIRSKNVLIIFQFVISIMLVIITLMVNKQYHYMSEMPLGFDNKMVMQIPLTNTLKTNYQGLKSELTKIGKVKNICTASSMPAGIPNNSGVIWTDDKGVQHDESFAFAIVSDGYTQTFDMKMAAGDEFIAEKTDDLKGVLINETAAKQLGFDDPVGKQIKFWGRENTIVGVVKDFQNNFIFNQVKPMVMSAHPENQGFTKFLFVSIMPGDVEHTINTLEKTIKEISPDFPFEYTFTNAEVAAYIDEIKKINATFRFASIISIILALVGLIALTYHATQARTKEIGVRKVNGARNTEIITLLNKAFVRNILIAYGVACPVAWLIVHRLLQGIDNKTTITVDIFLAAGFIIGFIALLTVSFQSWKAATRNPVEALRYE